MSQANKLSDRIRRGETVPWYLDALLSAAAPLYGIGMLVRSIPSPTRVSARVISFGNLTAGGTGKTPAVIERALSETALGNKVAVLTRGYGAKDRTSSLLVMESIEAQHAADRLGDEPALIARRVPGVVIARCSNRVAGAEAAIERGCDVLILDDGYQYLRLARDENVLLIDARNPFGNGKLIPRGILRERPAAARRATQIILTHCDNVDERALRTLRESLRDWNPTAPIRQTRHAPDTCWPLSGGENLPLSALRGQEFTAVCGIANPEYFASTLEDLGVRIMERRFFGDHEPIPQRALEGRFPIITTEKDAIRTGPTRANVYALGIRLEDIEWEALRENDTHLR